MKKSDESQRNLITVLMILMVMGYLGIGPNSAQDAAQAVQSAVSPTTTHH